MADQRNKQNEIKSVSDVSLKNDLTAFKEHSSEHNFLRKRLQTFQKTLVRDFEKRLDEEIEDVVQELRKRELQRSEFRNFAKPQNGRTWSNRHLPTEESNKQSRSAATEAKEDRLSNIEETRTASESAVTPQRRRRALPDKVFVMRESYLTALLEVNHMRTIYHIFTTILLVLLLNSICFDYFAEGRVYFGLGTFKAGLDKIHYVFGVWLVEHVFVFLVYYAFKMWAAVREKLRRQHSLQSFWSHSCLITYISSQLVFGYVATAICLKLNLTFVAGSVMLLETTRLLMKMHAFVRTNAARVLAGKEKIDTDSNECDSEQSSMAAHLPPFNCYLYFLFAPTLIYRDSYPRTTHIRWKFALARFMEIVAIAFLYSYLFERHIKVHFSNFGREQLNANMLIVKLHSMIMPSTIIFLCGFYLILHSWLNFTSELLHFGDRMFYKDWWTSSSYDEFFRNWNVVVHDWLYEYIYKDVYNHLFKGSKLAASLMVFYTSALVHEHIIGFALRFFFPVMLVFFGGLAVIFVFLTRNAPKSLGNFLVWSTLIIGNGLMVSLYSMEHYARANCSRTYEQWTDYLVPTVWACYNKQQT